MRTSPREQVRESPRDREVKRVLQPSVLAEGVALQHDPPAVGPDHEVESAERKDEGPQEPEHPGDHARGWLDDLVLQAAVIRAPVDAGRRGTGVDADGEDPL